MEQFEIERKSNRIIYLIKDTGLEFYLFIPNNKKVSIVINVKENINNDIAKSIPDLTDKVLVIPILNPDIINYLKMPASTYEQADNYFSALINTSYKILTHNNITVDPMVYINNDNIFNNFNNYFVRKFNGRVGIINLNLQNNIPIQPSNIPSPQIVESNKITEEKKELPKDLDSIYNEEIVLKEENSNKNETNKKEPGFVSYVLLGVMIAILSLIFLYMLL